ncbi:MAG TPA: hypothetical protein DFR83_02700, partial [Deltaproteobacteria bacterium]|nr:hypothetical protein [Deltaproteobacteria bacterium]
MLLTALSAFFCAVASPPTIERAAGHFPIDLRQPSFETLIPTHDFEGLEVDVRPAGFGHTLHLYGTDRTLRTATPVATIRLDNRRRPRIVSHRILPVVPSTAPPLTPDALRAALNLHLGSAPDLVGPIRLWAVGDAYRPLRAVSYDHPIRDMARPTYLVDPSTGRIVDRFDATFERPGHTSDGRKAPSALVYPVDPIRTPETVDVRMPESTRFGLTSSHFDVYNCVDLGETYRANTDLGEVDLRMCTHRSPLPPDGGQWRFSPVPYPEDTNLDEDDFAGPHLLWHGEQTIASLTALGLPLDDRPSEWQRLKTLSNYRLTDLSSEAAMSDPEGPLSAYDNAFFRRGRETSEGEPTPPELVFGQGTVGDFAYDADVIIHEIGHFAVWTQGGPSYVRTTEHGSSAEPGALNEGLADYFAAILTDDPEIATYSGDALGRSYIRTLDGEARCPDSLMGQVHADSQPFSQALWSYRSTLEPTDQALLDRSIVDALPTIGSTGGFSTAVEAVVAEVDLQLSAAHAEALFTEFSRRSVHACDPHVPVTESGVEVRSYSLVPAFYPNSYHDPIPGYVQFRINEDGPIDVVVEFIQRKSTEVDLYGTNDPQDVLFLHKSGGPIVHDGYFDDDLDRWVWSHDGELVGTATRTAEIGATFDGPEVEYA